LEAAWQSFGRWGEEVYLERFDQKKGLLLQVGRDHVVEQVKRDRKVKFKKEGFGRSGEKHYHLAKKKTGRDR